MTTKPKRKKIVKIDSKQVKAFMTWVLDKWIFYGDPWVEWWKTIGEPQFIKWAGERKIEYIKKSKKI